jgi:hypothetical protein
MVLLVGSWGVVRGGVREEGRWSGEKNGREEGGRGLKTEDEW